MNNKIRSLFFLTAIFFSGLFAHAGWNHHESASPEWLSVAVSDFKNGKFMPDLVDVLPGAAFGSNFFPLHEVNIGTTTTLQADRETDLNETLDGLKVIKASQLKFAFEIDWVLDNFNAVQKLTESQRLNSIRQFENSSVERQGVWQDGFKYEETSSKDRIIYMNKESERLKLSISADGVNEIYSSTTTSEKKEVDIYSSFKGEQFIYVEKQVEGTKEEFRYFEFDQTDGKKKGTMIWFYFNPDSDTLFLENGHKVRAYSFDGDDKRIELYSHSCQHLIGSSAVSSGSISVVEDGFGVRYGLSSTGNESMRLDARALNIGEIYFDDEIPFRTSVFAHGIVLDNGEKIIFDRFDSDMTNNPSPQFLLVGNVYDEQNEKKLTDEYYAGLFFYSQSGFSGSLHDMLSAHYPGLRTKLNFDYERYRPIAVNLLKEGLTSEVKALNISRINIEKWDDFKETINKYIVSKNTGFN